MRLLSGMSHRVRGSQKTEPVLSKIADCVRAVENGKDYAHESECEKDRSRSDGIDVSIRGLQIGESSKVQALRILG